MNHRLPPLLAALLLTAACTPPPPTSAPATPPRLVVLISIDQFRPDYLTRFARHFGSGGFRRFLEGGAVYRNAAYSHLPTFTCPGHATIASGAHPAVSGIVGNRWFDRESGRVVGCVDPLGVTDQTERSPRSMLVTTVGDELELATNGAAKVIGLGLKDYAAMTLTGRLGDLALWYDRGTGQWKSSSHYLGEDGVLPDWVAQLNEEGPAKRFEGGVWEPLLGPEAYRDANPDPVYEQDQEAPYGYGWRFPHRLGTSDEGGVFHARVVASPFGNDLLLDAARRAVEREEMGRDETPDLLALSLSSNDYVGHFFGPSSPEVIDASVRTDRQLAEFAGFLLERVARRDLLLVVTSDHGVQYVPREIRDKGGFAGRVFHEDLEGAVQGALRSRFGEGDWVLAVLDLDVYLNRSLIEQRGLDAAVVERAAAEAAQELEGIQQAFTRSQILAGRLPPGDLGERVAASFHPKRSGDLVLAYASNWFFHERIITTHGPHHASNTRVPILLWGGAVAAGSHWRAVDPRDIAPTLSELLAIGHPSGSSGQPLSEALR